MLGKKRRDVYNVPDCKRDGQWLKYYQEVIEAENTRCHTKAGMLWKAINSRCSPGGCQQTKRPNYEGCSVRFSDFQQFASWCIRQDGYLRKNPNGTYWQIDKDLLVKGNKVYGPETCLFLPYSINNLITTRGARRGDHPLGVHFSKGSGDYRAQCSVGNSQQRILGHFDSPMDAHRAWQMAKHEQILKHSVDEELPIKVREALVNRAALLKADIDAGIETKEL